MNFNFSEEVRKALGRAREEALQLRHAYVSTEHLLLGLLGEGEGRAVALLDALHVDRDRLREDVGARAQPGRLAIVRSDLPYTTLGKNTLEYTVTEARAMGDATVDTGHLLLGLIREEKGIAAQALSDAGVTLDEARSKLLELDASGDGAPYRDESSMRRRTDIQPAPQLEVLRPDGWLASGYSNGIIASGRQLFVAGQVGWDPQTAKFEATDFVGQVRQALRNIAAVLDEAGAEPNQVVRMTWYITDRDAYTSSRREIGIAYREIFGRHYPAMSVVVVAGLIEEGALVEIEATAVLPD